MTDRRPPAAAIGAPVPGLGRAIGADALRPVNLAVALHDRVRDTVRFGWGPRFYAESPQETEARRIGYAVTKSALLVQLLRARGLEARLVFAEIDAGLLRGILGAGSERLDHAYVELRLAGAWIGFDSHVVDAPMIAAAKARLAGEGRAAGWGIHATATGLFPSWSQFAAPLRGRVWGSFESLDAFFESRAVVHNRLPWVVRRAFAPIARRANARIEALRSGA